MTAGQLAQSIVCRPPSDIVDAASTALADLTDYSRRREHRTLVLEVIDSTIRAANCSGADRPDGASEQFVSIRLSELIWPGDASFKELSNE
jgi:hypothetical protein